MTEEPNISCKNKEADTGCHGVTTCSSTALILIHTDYNFFRHPAHGSDSLPAVAYNFDALENAAEEV